MEPFISLEGVVCPLDRSNVDTDAIIPKQFLKSIQRSGFGPYLFDSWRYLDAGEPGMDCTHRPRNPDFVLNDPRYASAPILLTRENFGCGSSREHAPWALLDHGFRVLLAPGYADIFYNNCFKNGILPVVLPGAEIDALFQAAGGSEPLRLTVDLAGQQIRYPDGRTLHFKIDAFRKQRLLQGLDDIGLTLEHAEAIRGYEARRRETAPWLFSDHLL